MKNAKKTNRRFAKQRKMAVAATLVAVPMLAAPALAQKGGQVDTVSRSKTSAGRVPAYLKFQNRFIKMDQPLTIAGLDEGHTVYKNAQGEYFYIDPATGDMKTIAADTYIKFFSTYIKGSARMLKHIKFEGSLKHYPSVVIVGVDADGNTLMKNQSGEIFHLDPKTGDMVYQR